MGYTPFANGMISINKPITKTVKVKKGDTLYSIAERHHVSTHDLEKWNKIPHNQLRLGQTLVLSWDAVRENPARPATNDKSDKAKHGSVSHKNHTHVTTTQYTVKKGDTLHSIAAKFDVAIDDIQEWNSLKHHAIKPGVKLKLKVS